MSDQARAPLQLPEVQWTFRRIYTYALTVILAGLLAYVISRTSDAGALKTFGLCLCGLIALQTLLYTAGATVTDIWRLVSAVRGLRASPAEPSGGRP